MKKNENKKETLNNVDVTNNLLKDLCKDDNYSIVAYSHGAKINSKAIKRSICEVHINNNSNMVASNKILTKHEKMATPHYKKSDVDKKAPYYYTFNNVKSKDVVKLIKELEKAYKK